MYKNVNTIYMKLMMLLLVVFCLTHIFILSFQDSNKTIEEDTDEDNSYKVTEEVKLQTLLYSCY